MDLLVSPDRLAAEIGAPDLRILDATFYALEPGRDAAARFGAEHIPGARFLDLEHLADPDEPLPSTLPTPAFFAERLGALGVAADDRIVLYDDAPHHTSARAWWMLRLMGARQVAILDGGLAGWRAAGLPVEAGDGETFEPATFTPRPDRATLRGLDAVRLAALDGSEQIVDARGTRRFTGEEADPRPGVAPGHIPGSLNLPYDQLFAADGRWKRGEALADAFRDAGVDLDRPVITTCGSGITASVLLFGLALLGKADVALYDGSWSQWGADPTTPKVLGR